MNFLEKIIDKKHNVIIVTNEKNNIIQEISNIIYKKYNTNEILFFIDKINAEISRDIVVSSNINNIHNIKFVIIKEIDDISSNILLKTIEESETNIMFIFVIENVFHILPTIQSRCVIHYLYKNYSYENMEKIFQIVDYVRNSKIGKIPLDKEKITYEEIKNIFINLKYVFLQAFNNFDNVSQKISYIQENDKIYLLDSIQIIEDFEKYFLSKVNSEMCLEAMILKLKARYIENM